MAKSLTELVSPTLAVGFDKKLSKDQFLGVALRKYQSPDTSALTVAKAVEQAMENYRERFGIEPETFGDIDRNIDTRLKGYSSSRTSSTASGRLRQQAMGEFPHRSPTTVKAAVNSAIKSYRSWVDTDPSFEDIRHRLEMDLGEGGKRRYGPGARAAAAKARREKRQAIAEGRKPMNVAEIEEEILNDTLKGSREITDTPKTKRPGRLARRAFEEFPLRTAVEVGEGKERRISRSKFGGHLEATERLAGGDLAKLEKIVDDPTFRAGASTGRERFVSREAMLARHQGNPSVIGLRPDELKVPGSKGIGATSEDLRRSAMRRLQDITSGEAVAETRRGLGLTAEKRLTAQQRARTTLQRIQEQIDDLNPQRRVNVEKQGSVKVYKSVKPPRMHRLPADVAEKLGGGNWATPEGKALIQQRIRTLEKRAGILKEGLSRGGEAAPQVRSERLAQLARENVAKRPPVPTRPLSRTSPVLGGKGPVQTPTKLQQLVRSGGRLGTKTKALGFLGALAQPFATAEAITDLFSDDPNRQQAAMEFFSGLEPGTSGRGLTDREKLEQEKAGLPWYDPRTRAGGV